MAETKKRSRRKRKSSKYLPLLWLLTGALLALVLVFSGNLVIDVKGIQPSSPQKTPKPPLSQEKPSSSNLPEKEKESKTIKIYLARQLEKGVRLVPYSITITETTTPMQAALEALIHATDDNDLNLIPPDTRIRQAWIKDNYAYIDLSEEFTYNAYGIQGYKLQLYQIVLTVCQFPTIKGVYFYVEGKPLRYLGGEGFPIPQPVLPPKEPFEIPY
ncbi:GerMN domain-containing protein [Thermospira aquatica]|uniref:GerMN domain-containing protein n=1 Tax=Thermospira aquatica TaxID=2828656 RepID=A0AAX3BFA8_9SPIR|nr:GerMN domain-containing protein [Thermospira aquatica]URA10955.1 GerMN domain-containing protein [Thermospira aquatica]